MQDMTVFYVVPVLLLFFTWFFGSLAPLARESKEFWWAWPFPLLLVIGANVLNYYNRDSLQSLFHGKGQHMGYYEALMMYGTGTAQWFNWIFIGITAVFITITFLFCLFKVNITK